MTTKRILKDIRVFVIQSPPPPPPPPLDNLFAILKDAIQNSMIDIKVPNV